MVWKFICKSYQTILIHNVCSQIIDNRGTRSQEVRQNDVGREYVVVFEVLIVINDHTHSD